MTFDPELMERIRRGEGRAVPGPGQLPQIDPTLLINQQTGQKMLAPTVAVATFHNDAMNQFASFMSMRDDLTKAFVAATVAQQRNMRHKKKTGRAGDWTPLEVAGHLIEEVGELKDAIIDDLGVPPAGKSSMREKVLSETADVLCVLYAIMVKYGFTLQEVNVRGLAKLEERFTDEPSEEEMLVKGGEAPA